MPEIACRVDAIDTVAHSAVPALAFALEIVNRGREPIAGIDLRCQIMIEAPRRTYSSAELARLVELFGREGEPLQPLLWTHANVNVPAFDDACRVDLNVPCTFDFNVAVAKYFGALSTDDVPLCLQFSGTMFFTDSLGRLQISRIPWSCEARCALALSAWSRLRDRYYPGTVWLCLSRNAFDRLCDYKAHAGLPSWEGALDSLLAVAEETDRVTERAR